jgi:hypothetical protein
LSAYFRGLENLRSVEEPFARAAQIFVDSSAKYAKKDFRIVGAGFKPALLAEIYY